jgi:hypothetical protein
MGTQDVEKTLASTQGDAMGNPAFSQWHKDHAAVNLVTHARAVAHGEIVIEALKGEIALGALAQLKEQLAGKILVDIANPLDFSKGMPPTLLICNTDSLGEQIQNALPETKVVKAFNTTSALLQVDPGQLADSDHHLFICGNDGDATAKVTTIAQG